MLHWQQCNLLEKQLLFISTVNLTTNPRILKEIRLAAAQGYRVIFLGFSLGNWSDELEEKLKSELQGVELIYLDATRKRYASWLTSTLTEKIAGLLNKVAPNSLLLSAFASSKRSVLLCRQLKKIKAKGIAPDLLIAHTLGALYPAFVFAQKNVIPFGFDVEDYHPWESINGNSRDEAARRETILKQILPHARYVSTAAPLISSQVKRLVPGTYPQTIYNSFPKNEFIKPAILKGEKMKLVWFSQNINAGRGLELILSEWENLKQDFELTLIGKLDNAFYDQYIKGHPGIIIKPPLPQSGLHQLLSGFDIGLAIDVDDHDKNRQLVITNKILAYYQAGLFIVATNTPAQQQFIEDHPAHGTIIMQDADEAAKSLLKISASKERLRLSAQERFDAAATFNWEKEAALLLQTWTHA